MAKKEKIEKTDLITHILIGIIELLVIIGYVFLWPIERSICFIAKIFNSIKKTSLKTAKNFISIPKTLTKPLFLIFSVFGRVRRTITRIVVFSFRADLLGPARSELSRYRSIFVKASFSRIVGKILFTKHKSKRSSKTNKPTQAAKTKKEPAGSKNIPLDKSLKKKSVKVSHPKRTALRKFLLSPFATFFYGGLFVLLFIVAPAMTYLWYKQLPQPVLLEQRAYNSSTRILDRKGRLLYEIYVDKNYAPVRLEDIPQVVIDSTLAIEDSEFYSHHGFRVTSIVRAAKATLLEDDLQGASTITQQLVKNVLLTPERTISRKVKELVLSILVEQKYSKNEILEFYLNNIPYGGTAYGVQAAANKYFGKDVSDLDLAEASLLAGLPSAPSVYSPVSGNYDLAKERQKQVLDRMVELGFIRSADAEVAYAQELVFASQQEYIRAPHFVEFVRKSLYEIFGQRMVDFGGLSVTTTLDLDLQDQVQEIVREEVDAGARFGFSNAAAVVVDVRTGGILAHVGSYDYFLGSDGKFDVATAYRQPGSSVKPITYALALENGMTAASTVVDAPITYQSYGQKYSPKNYDNTYHGVVTLRTALANSYNIPAVKLVSQLGPDNMVQLGHDMGLSNWKVDNTYGLAVTLGGKEVRLVDLVGAFSTFARSGRQRPISPFASIKDSNGFEIYNITRNYEKQVLSPQTSYIISNILSDNNARTPAFGPRSQLVVPGHVVSVKTGTTNDIRDNWTIGYTPTYAVGVWVGNNDNRAMNRNLASGLSGAAPIWNRVMGSVLKDIPDEPFIIPDGIVVKTDPSCGAIEVFDEKNPIPSRICPAPKEKDSDKDKDKENKKD